MAYDASTPHTIRAPWAPRKTSEFNSSERVVVILGATAAGLVFGALAALTIGLVNQPLIIATILLLYGLAFSIAAGSFAETVAARAWTAAVFHAVHLLAFAIWPFAVMRFDPGSVQFWLGIATLLASLLAFLASARPAPRTIYRSVAEAALIAALTGYWGVCAAIGV